MPSRRVTAVDTCVSGSWRGAVGGVVWGLPAVAVYPGLILIVTAVAATVGSLLGFLAAVPARAVINGGATRRTAALVGALSAVALWTTVVVAACLLLDVREGYINYGTVGPAIVAGVCGWWNAVASHRSAEVSPAATGRPDLAWAWFIAVAAGLVGLAILVSRNPGEGGVGEDSPRLPAACQERSGGGNSCPGG